MLKIQCSEVFIGTLIAPKEFLRELIDWFCYNVFQQEFICFVLLTHFCS